MWRMSGSSQGHAGPARGWPRLRQRRLLLWPAPPPPVPPSVAPRTPAQYALRCQVSAAVSPDNEAANSFRECVLIRHPRRDGELAFAFITGQTVLQVG